MIATVALVLGGFAFLVLRAYRAGAADYRPHGKLRWTADTEQPPRA
jgi:hypothetical protein